MSEFALRCHRIRQGVAAICLVAVVSGCSSSPAPTAGGSQENPRKADEVASPPATPSSAPAMPTAWATEFCDAVTTWLGRVQVNAATALPRTVSDRRFREAFADASRATETLTGRLRTAEGIVFAPPGVEQITVATEAIAVRIGQASHLAEAASGSSDRGHPDERHNLALTLVASQYALVNALVPGPGGAVGYSVQSVLKSEPGCSGLLAHESVVPLAPTENVTPSLAVTREARWAEDIDFLLRWLPRLHAARFLVDPSAKIEQPLTDLKERVPTLSDVDVLLELQKAVTLLADVHTQVESLPGMFELTTLPLTFGWFSDGLYITGANSANRALVGKRVTHIGELPASLALEKLALYMPRENDWGIQAMVGPFLQSSQTLVAAGISAPGPVHFRFEDGTTADVRPRPEPAPPVSIDSRLPAWARPVIGPYPVSEPDPDTVYARIPSFVDSGRVEAAVATMLARVELRERKKLIIDFRGNEGGIISVATDFVNAIAKLKSERPQVSIMVLTDGGTLSAAVAATVVLRERVSAIQIGQGTGQRPTSYGGLSYFVLPNSGLVVTFSTGIFQAPVKYGGGGLVPDVRITTSGVEVFRGEDPVLNAALAR